MMPAEAFQLALIDRAPCGSWRATFFARSGQRVSRRSELRGSPGDVEAVVVDMLTEVGSMTTPRFAVPECTHAGPGRCASTSCRYSMRSDWQNRGGLPSDSPVCALEVATAADEFGGLTLATVGVLLGGITKERVRQIEANALGKLEHHVRQQNGAEQR